MVKEGCNKVFLVFFQAPETAGLLLLLLQYPSGLFRLPMMNGWHVVLTKREYIEELRKAPEELASLDIILEEV